MIIVDHPKLPSISADNNYFNTSIITCASVMAHFLKISSLFLLYLEAIVIVTKEEPVLYHQLIISCFLVLLFTFKSFPIFKHEAIYLVDFSCFKLPIFSRAASSTYIEHARLVEFWDKKTLSFIENVLRISGLGEETHLPPSLHYIPPKSSHKDAIEEAHMSLFSAFNDLLMKTKLSPFDIDILIVNCSGFCPVPSLSDIIVNKFLLREDVKCFNLSGMGCTAGLMGMDMAQNIMKTHPNSNAVIVSTEILSTGWYPGLNRSMMLLNCTFRWGASAILISNKRKYRNFAKYELVLALRNQRAFDDTGYYGSYREEDSEGVTGFTVKKEVFEALKETVRSNVTILALSILPFFQIVLYGISIFYRKFIHRTSDNYVPNFKTAIQHFCLVPSGKPIIKVTAEVLKLGEDYTEPAMMTLHRFGNQSSSSIWYELAYMEAKERVKPGDKVWQLAVGSGPKCISLVWKCNRTIAGDEAQRGPWADSIDNYPILKSC
ncbi:hypothetical protein Leryth_018264 [Lithospermum erythrorhizon]|uniref:3-ketoacyl-CoA synthase n=1 Tax=Lithospermum erythrorhizon TaxID=34254 RepID=A0AAV3QM08_LITER|nr:hypothetical protein Leryth_018264 [Lithospermum erythrorhizon]